MGWCNFFSSVVQFLSFSEQMVTWKKCHVRQPRQICRSILDESWGLKATTKSEHSRRSLDSLDRLIKLWRASLFASFRPSVTVCWQSEYIPDILSQDIGPLNIFTSSGQDSFQVWLWRHGRSHDRSFRMQACHLAHISVSWNMKDLNEDMIYFNWHVLFSLLWLSWNVFPLGRSPFGGSLEEPRVPTVCIYGADSNQSWPQPGWSKHLFFVCVACTDGLLSSQLEMKMSSSCTSCKCLI